MTDLPTSLQAVQRGATVRALSDRVLSVEGVDARSWLNGQITNDVRSTAEGDAVYALVVNVKGRVQSDLWVLDRGHDQFYLVVPPTTEALLRETFEDLIIMEEVELAARPDLAVVSVQGPEARTVASGMGGRLFPADRLGHGGVDLIVPAEEVQPIVARLREAGAVDLAESAWEVARVLSRRPRFGVDFDDKTYPQEAGLEQWAVSFQKGCYVGQEVVHMLQVRGQASRRLVPFELDMAAEVGQELTAADGKVVGRLTTVVAAEPEIRALGLVKRAHAEPGTELKAGPATARVLGG